MTKLAIRGSVTCVSTMNVSLPEELKAFVDERVDRGRFGSTSEYVRELIRRDHDREYLRHLLLSGAESAQGPIADTRYFADLRDRISSDT
jgi:antitoxin ParD1/3/4